MATFLITGGCGFIGSHLADSLLAQGHDVKVIDDLSTGHVDNLDPRCDLTVADMRDTAVMRSLMQGIDGVFHLAAVSSVQRSNEAWSDTHSINLSAFVQLLDEARIEKIPVVYASSAAVYGDNAETPLKENSALRPLTAYGADKLGCELHARVASLIHGVPTMGMRFFNVYGPRQDPNSPYSGVISIFVKQVLEGNPITVFGDGEQVRDFVHVSDVVAHLLAAMEKVSTRAEVLNVCRGTPTRIMDLAINLMAVASRRVPILSAPARQGDIRSSIGSPAYTQRVLNVQADTDMSLALRELIELSAPHQLAS